MKGLKVLFDMVLWGVIIIFIIVIATWIRNFVNKRKADKEHKRIRYAKDFRKWKKKYLKNCEERYG